VLVECDQADLPSARSWREPSGAGHVRRDALGLRVAVCDAREVQGRVEIAVLNVPASAVVAGEDALARA